MSSAPDRDPPHDGHNHSRPRTMPRPWQRPEAEEYDDLEGLEPFERFHSHRPAFRPWRRPRGISYR